MFLMRASASERLWGVFGGNLTPQSQAKSCLLRDKSHSGRMIHNQHQVASFVRVIEAYGKIIGGAVQLSKWCGEDPGYEEAGAIQNAKVQVF